MDEEEKRNRQREATRRWRERNPGYGAKAMKEYRDKHPDYVERHRIKNNERIAKNRREKWKNDPEFRKAEKIKAKERHKKKRHVYRQQVIEAYGGKCEVCGISELRFLTLDHSFQDGAEHRRSLGDSKNSGSNKVYADIVRRGFPKDEGYRILCWNHNCGGAY